MFISVHEHELQWCNKRKVKQVTSAMPRVTVNLDKLRFPIHTFFFIKIREKII